MTVVTTESIGCWAVALLVGLLTAGALLLGMRRWLKAQRQALMATVEHLRDADRLTTRHQVTAEMAHLLGTPLNVISGRAKMIASGEDAAENARIIEAQIARVTQALHLLLKEARQAPSGAPCCAIDGLFKQTQALSAPLVESAHRRMALMPRSGLTVAIPPTEALTMLTQLVKAMIARPDGGKISLVATREEVSAPPDPRAAPGSYVCIQLTTDAAGRAVKRPDGGPNGGPNDRPEPAARATRRETALGLSVCQHIVQERGGWMDGIDELGYGAAVCVYLPEWETTED